VTDFCPLRTADAQDVQDGDDDDDVELEGSFFYVNREGGGRD
jgi:hypothetical protein